jgi:Cu/Zn superoxide dismutase
MNHAKKGKIVVAGLLLTFMLIVAACSTSQQTTTDNPASTGSSTPTNQVTQTKATLSHTPSGTSNLTWNAANHTLTVQVWLTGLAPKSTHVGHIHKGDCKSNGSIVYPMTDTVADDKGVGTSETIIKDVTTGIPQDGWYINIHNGGTGLTQDLQAMPIACANITNPNPSTSSDQSVKDLKLEGTSAPNQSVSGDAQLSIENGKLKVTVTVSGLVPNSKHIAHIHQGTCEAQGAGVLYPLDPVVADANGKGTSTTTVDQVTSIPSSGWYINVHLGATADDLSTQTGFDPITCGNVVAA